MKNKYQNECYLMIFNKYPKQNWKLKTKKTL